MTDLDKKDKAKTMIGESVWSSSWSTIFLKPKNEIDVEDIWKEIYRNYIDSEDGVDSPEEILRSEEEGEVEARPVEDENDG